MNVYTFEHTDVEELALVLDNVLEIDVVGVLTLVDFEVDTLVGILTLRYLCRHLNMSRILLLFVN